MDSYLRRLIMRRLCDELRRSESHQRLIHIVNVGLQFGRNQMLSYADKDGEDNEYDDFNVADCITYQ